MPKKDNDSEKKHYIYSRTVLLTRREYERIVYPDDGEDRKLLLDFSKEDPRIRANPEVNIE